MGMIIIINEKIDGKYLGKNEKNPHSPKWDQNLH